GARGDLDRQRPGYPAPHFPGRRRPGTGGGHVRSLLGFRSRHGWPAHHQGGQHPGGGTMIRKAGEQQAVESLNPSDAIDFMCAEARRQGADGFDAVAGESESMGIELFEGKVKSTEISNSRGIGIRLFKDKRPGFAFTEKMSREAIAQTVKDALSHTLLTDPVEMDLPFPETLPDID